MVCQHLWNRYSYLVVPRQALWAQRWGPGLFSMSLGPLLSLGVFSQLHEAWAGEGNVDLATFH